MRVAPHRICNLIQGDTLWSFEGRKSGKHDIQEFRIYEITYDPNSFMTFKLKIVQQLDSYFRF